MMLGGTGGVTHRINMAGRVRRVRPATEEAAGTTSAIKVPPYIHLIPAVFLLLTPALLTYSVELTLLGFN